MNPGPPVDPQPAPDDDPTHALDDFVRRMRQPDGSSGPAPDLSDLGDLSGLAARIHPERAVPPPRAKGGVLRSGQRWAADEVQDVPVLDLPRAPPLRSDIPAVTLPMVDLVAEQAQAALSPEVSLPEVAVAEAADVDALDQATRHASQQAAAAYSAEAREADAPVWQPDPSALQLRPSANPRLLAQWQREAWVGAVRQVSGSATELVNTATGPVVETYAPNQLLLLWPPQHGGPPTTGRWPARVMLTAVVPGPAAAEAALAQLPADAPLWLAAGDAAEALADWALAAEIVLHHQPGLRPFQTEGLRNFIGTEREASFARLNAGYHLPVDGGAVVRR